MHVFPLLGRDLSSAVFLLYVEDEVWEQPYEWFTCHQLRARVFHIDGTKRLSLREFKISVCFRKLFLRRKRRAGRTEKAFQEEIPLLTIGLKLIISNARNKSFKMCWFFHTCAVDFVSSTGCMGRIEQECMGRLDRLEEKGVFVDELLIALKMSLFYVMKRWKAWWSVQFLMHIATLSCQPKLLLRLIKYRHPFPNFKFVISFIEESRMSNVRNVN